MPPTYSYSPPDYYYIINATEPPSIEQFTAERERIRAEFFSTYDVMTGVRIATTLGGFFGLMVFLVIYKSRGERLETMNALKVIFESISAHKLCVSTRATIEMTNTFAGSENSSCRSGLHARRRGS